MKDSRLTRIRGLSGEAVGIVAELRSEMDPGGREDIALKRLNSYLLWVVSGAWELEDDQ